MIRAIGQLLCAAPLLALSCTKVPIIPVNAEFKLADASWFEEEDTLFLFYEVKAEQGLGEPSVIEVRWTTDDQVVDWTPVDELELVHQHVDVKCGRKRLCGSASVAVHSQPRDVDIRLLYHRDGQLALDAETVVNLVGVGPPHDARSLIVYGVFDETNQRVQWRARHQFPTIRNHQATDLGLRRNFTITDQRYGTEDPSTPQNPYGYGRPCNESFVDLGMPLVTTNQRAVFNEDDLPLGAMPHSTVCADATVSDANGSFTTVANARKNPEVYPAFPVLRSPVRNATPLKFFISPCDRRINKKHEDMQRQRLGMEGVPETCSEGFLQQGWVDDLIVDFADAIEAERPSGNDMVLVVGVHQDDDRVADAVEQALAAVLPDERLRSSPRVAGAFVLDSSIRGLEDPELSPVTLWCPSTLPLDSLPDVSSRTCAIAPDNPDFELGPFSFGTLPILPSRDQYLDFVDTYSINQAGEVTELSYRTPEFSVLADHIGLDEFGAVTFLNNESFGADADDAFSFCRNKKEPSDFFVFRSALLDSAQLDFYTCLYYTDLPEDVCAAVEFGVAPIEYLPEWHALFGESSYELGIFWEFPFLLRMEFQAPIAGAVSAFGFSVPFGIANSAESYYGTELWTQDEFPLTETLTQCERFCDHPTFDSAGVYHVTDPFRTTYATNCYLPNYPIIGEGGFPLDP